ncbi:MAG TPA: hypothetical protein VM869_28255, partial [Enhygromyxa sp.]|nr:hypothetical protein [Enhygromyxa sp.]
VVREPIEGPPDRDRPRAAKALAPDPRLLGDSGCQVFSAHGSGIGVGLLAGKMLAESLVRGDGLPGYQRRFMREQGGVLAAYDVFRRYSQHMHTDDLLTLMRAGLIDAESSAAATAQRLPTLDLKTAKHKLEALTRAPTQALALAPTVARMAAAVGLYRAYPDEPDYLHHWSRAIARVVGDREPDITRT